MFRLNFTSRVLGREAATRLARKKVTQTIRSTSETVLANHRRFLEIALDGHFIGTARQLSTDMVKLDDLTIDDAQLGGFDTIPELASALRRAGYRFKPIEEYQFLRVRFEWVGGSR